MLGEEEGEDISVSQSEAEWKASRGCDNRAFIRKVFKVFQQTSNVEILLREKVLEQSLPQPPLLDSLACRECERKQSEFYGRRVFTVVSLVAP